MILTPDDRRNLERTEAQPEEHAALVAYLEGLEANRRAWWASSPLVQIYSDFCDKLASGFPFPRDDADRASFERDPDAYFADRAVYVACLQKRVGHLEYWAHHLTQRAQVFQALRFMARVTQGDPQDFVGQGVRWIGVWLQQQEDALGDFDDEPLPRCMPEQRLQDEYDALVAHVHAEYSKGHSMCRFPERVVQQIGRLAFEKPRTPYAFLERVEKASRDAMVDLCDAFGFQVGPRVIEGWLLATD